MACEGQRLVTTRHVCDCRETLTASLDGAVVARLCASSTCAVLPLSGDSDQRCLRSGVLLLVCPRPFSD